MLLIPSGFLVKHSAVLLSILLLLSCALISLSDLGSELYFSVMWDNVLLNPVYFLLAAASAFVYGYIRSFRKQVLDTTDRLDIFWTSIIALAVFFISSNLIFLAGFLVYGILIDDSTITTERLTPVVLIIFIFSIAGQITGSYFTEPHYADFLDRSFLEEV
ncbi:MAG: hypothetical protein ACFFD4_28115 [Candidatus Odinarchaeota archaeon]